MSLQALVQKLVDAETALLEWGKQEVCEVNILNKAYRDIYEALAMIKSGRVKDIKPSKDLAEKIEEALSQLEEAIKSCRTEKTRRNPAIHHVLAAYDSIIDAFKVLGL